MGDPSAVALTVEWENTLVVTQQLHPAATVGGVTIDLVDLGTPADFGDLPYTVFEEPRVMMDGLAFYGGVFAAARDMVLPLWCKCGDGATALDFIRTLHRWFVYDDISKGILTVSRKDGSDNDISCTIEAVAMNRRAFMNTPAPGVGVIGNLGDGNLLYLVHLHAPYPHFRDTDTSNYEEMTWSGSNIDFTIDNDGCTTIGMKLVTAVATGTVTSLTVTNQDTGRYVTVTDDFNSIITVDWYGSRNDTWSVKDGSTEDASMINVGAKMHLLPGTNNIRVSGTGTGSVHLWLYWYPEYDSV